MASEKDLRASKDNIVAALFELSKASGEAAKATVDFFNAIEVNGDHSKDIKDLASSLALLSQSVKSVNQLGIFLNNDANKKVVKKPKVEKDPNAPKKPLTSFFAYSAHWKKLHYDKLREERARKGEPALSSVELTQIISQKWNEITDKEKDEWKKKYYAELGNYNIEKEKYEKTKANGGTIEIAPDLSSSTIVPASIDQEEESKKKKKRKTDDEEGDEERKKEKKKEKKKKKLAAE
ncbi:hypothetical protein PACTADRAFT_78316 [Pachysolen tannophilus NRRL Y-2460]|uniref:HMG box domain-containing protein n=1 Tax=Pachysolen tannophilus NRRL Y-2460 TaxID=669874 RepID=A0A1E4U1K1_PACTA|nr:hypothetical protein PACTADRAFT_78316 [Pachysolen tannophilus NRRL Y-2460]